MIDRIAFDVVFFVCDNVVAGRESANVVLVIWLNKKTLHKQS